MIDEMYTGPIRSIILTVDYYHAIKRKGSSSLKDGREVWLRIMGLFETRHIIYGWDSLFDTPRMRK